MIIFNKLIQYQKNIYYASIKNIIHNNKLFKFIKLNKNKIILLNNIIKGSVLLNFVNLIK